MPKVYRVMKEEDGRPACGESATTLGVRIPYDVPEDTSGQVHPGTGGMSVQASLETLPARLVPQRLRERVPGARGRDTLRIWSMGDGAFANGALSNRLSLRVDPSDPYHGFVEPDSSMPSEDYQKAIEATQGSWSIDEK